MTIFEQFKKLQALTQDLKQVINEMEVQAPELPGQVFRGLVDAEGSLEDVLGRLDKAASEGRKR